MLFRLQATLCLLSTAAVAGAVNEDFTVRRLADLNPGNGSSQMSHFVAVKDHVYFVSSPEFTDESNVNLEEIVSQIYSTNGENGVQVVEGTDTTFPDQLFSLNDHQVLFTGEDEEHGRELWVVDQERQAALVKDVNPGRSSAFLPFDAYPVFSGSEGQAYFVARTQDDQIDPEAFQLYRSDGTANGTQPVTSLDVSTRRLEFTRHSVHGLSNTFYFANNMENKRAEIWISQQHPGEYKMFELDGRLSNTFAISVLPESLNGMIVIIYAETWSSSEAFLWTIDPESGEQTNLMGSLWPSTFLPADARIGGDWLIHIVAKDTGTTNNEEPPTALVVTDGTTAGTNEIKAFDPLEEGYTTGLLALSEDKVMIFQQRDVDSEIFETQEATASGRMASLGFPNLAMDLWVTDGTAAGTSLAMKLPDNTSVMKGIAISGGRAVLLVTTLNDENQAHRAYELLVTNGTTNGTSTIYRTELSVKGSPDDPYMFSFFASQEFITFGDDKVIFTGYDREHGVEPWVIHFESRSKETLGSGLEDSLPASSSVSVDVVSSVASLSSFIIVLSLTHLLS